MITFGTDLFSHVDRYRRESRPDHTVPPGRIGLFGRPQAVNCLATIVLSLRDNLHVPYGLMRERLHRLVVLVARPIIIIVIVVIFSPRRTNCILTSKFLLNPTSGS